MEGCRQERRGIEGKGYGGAEGTGIAENLPMGHSCRGPQGPTKPGKNAQSTEDNRVRSRQVTPSRKTANNVKPRDALMVFGEKSPECRKYRIAAARILGEYAPHSKEV